MKKLFFLVVIVLWISVFWMCRVKAVYLPNSGDIAELNTLKIQLNTTIWANNQDLRSFYYQIRDLQNTYQFEPKIDYLLSELKAHLRSTLQSRKQQTKTLSRNDKYIFFEEYKSMINTGPALSNSCLGRYNTLDDIAFAHDYSTSVLIATRYRESDCGYYLPKNGDWPFQIVSKDYGTWHITEAIFVQSAVDFINFSKNKYERYATSNLASGHRVDLHYTGLTLSGIVRHGALYNGLSGYTVYGDISPLNPRYVWDNYGQDFSGSVRNGIAVQTLKMLEWELLYGF